MSDEGPEPRNPLSPYYPTEVPSVPTEGRRWVALLLLSVMLFGVVAAAAGAVLAVL